MSILGLGAWRKTMRIAVWGAIATLLAAPLAAMQLTNEVAWAAGDFAAAAALLAVVGAAFEVIFRRPQRLRVKSLLFAVVVAGVAFVWAIGAVGV